MSITSEIREYEEFTPAGFIDVRPKFIISLSYNKTYVISITPVPSERVRDNPVSFVYFHELFAKPFTVMCRGSDFVLKSIFVFFLME